MARANNRHETLHTWLKSFNIFLDAASATKKNTEHRRYLHKMVVESVAGIVQYDYENGHPPFSVR
jgi:hypothetical protein